MTRRPFFVPGVRAEGDYMTGSALSLIASAGNNGRESGRRRSLAAARRHTKDIA